MQMEFAFVWAVDFGNLVTVLAALIISGTLREVVVAYETNIVMVLLHHQHLHLGKNTRPHSISLSHHEGCNIKIRFHSITLSPVSA